MRIVAQHRFDAALLVVSRDQDEQAGVRHADSVTENFRAGNLGKWMVENNHQKKTGWLQKHAIR
jgi:hypothetical protein